MRDRKGGGGDRKTETDTETGTSIASTCHGVLPVSSLFAAKTLALWDRLRLFSHISRQCVGVCLVGFTSKLA